MYTSINTGMYAYTISYERRNSTLSVVTSKLYEFHLVKSLFFFCGNDIIQGLVVMIYNTITNN